MNEEGLTKRTFKLRQKRKNTDDINQWDEKSRINRYRTYGGQRRFSRESGN